MHSGPFLKSPEELIVIIMVLRVNTLVFIGIFSNDIVMHHVIFLFASYCLCKGLFHLYVHFQVFFRASLCYLLCVCISASTGPSHLIFKKNIICWLNCIFLCSLLMETIPPENLSLMMKNIWTQMTLIFSLVFLNVLIDCYLSKIAFISLQWCKDVPIQFSRINLWSG